MGMFSNDEGAEGSLDESADHPYYNYYIYDPLRLTRKPRKIETIARTIQKIGRPIHQMHRIDSISIVIVVIVVITYDHHHHQ